MKGKREEKERRKRGKEKNTTRESNKSADGVCVHTILTTVPGMKSDYVSEKQQIEKFKKSKKIEKREKKKEKISNYLTSDSSFG